MKWLVLALVLALVWRDASTYIITVDAHTEECFFDKVDFGTKMGLIFEIAEGGWMDIDVRIVAPDGKVMYNGERENSGKFTFAAHTPGMYTYCFSNLKGTMTPKVIMFNMDIGESPKPQVAGEAGAQDADSPNAKLGDMISELGNSLKSVKSEQEYMQIRDRNHREINESTNFRVVVWSFFEATALVCMTLGQVYYLKRFFEVRRVV